MLTSITLSIFMSLTGAQAILTLALFKGDICPGQRGRLHTQFIILNIIGYLLFFIYLPSSLFLFLSQLSLSFFILKNKKKKTSTSHFKSSLYLSNIINLALILFICSRLYFPQAFILIAQVFIIGSLLASVLMRYARSRLKHLMALMPYTGLIFSILLIINIAMIHLYYQPLNHQIIILCTGLMLLLLSLFLWIAQTLFNLKTSNYISTLHYLILLFSLSCINKSILI